MSEEQISSDAISFIKKEIREIIKKLSGGEIYEKTETPVSLFMAGSPGAGKTEVSKRLIAKFETKRPVRIDPDEIRNLLPGYNGTNAYLFQGACSVGVDKLYDYIIENCFNVIIDGTFASERTAFKNIERSLEHNRKIEIYYIYQEPLLAWEFTQAREVKEGRRISKDTFIEAFVNARENVNKAKSYFNNKVELNLIIKDFNNDSKKIEPDIINIDDYLPKIYTIDDLREIIIE